MARLDYPMLVVTAAAGGRRSGCLVGFWTQASIDPLRFLVCLSKRNATYRIARDAPVLGVHVLTTADEDLARLFGEVTGDDADKFSACEWDEGPHGVPLLRGGAGLFVGEVLDRRDSGDHDAFLLTPVQAEDRRSAHRALGFQDVSGFDPGHEA